MPAQQLRRTVSAVPSKAYQSGVKGHHGRSVHSAGSRPRKAQGSFLSLSLPQHSLRQAVDGIEKALTFEPEENHDHLKLEDMLRRVSGWLPIAMERSDWSLVSFCYECGRGRGVVLTCCPGCRLVKYCSRTCKTENWKRGGHQLECTGAQVPKSKTRRKK